MQNPHFISEFNRFHVGKIIIERNRNNEIIDEIGKIDLSDILYNNALKGKKENLFLKQLEDFTLIYKTLLRVLKTYKEVEEDTYTNYVHGTGTPSIDILETNVKDFYNYLLLNHLMIDSSSEVIEVYKQYVNAVFCSHSKEEKEYTDGILHLPGKNKVLKEISPFSIKIICKYLDEMSFDEVLEDNNVRRIVLSSDAERLLLEILSNYANAIESNILRVNVKRKLFMLLKIMAISNLSRENIEIVLDTINHLMIQGCFKDNDYNKISDFIVQKFNKNKELINTNSLSLIINAICEGFKRKTWGDYDLYYLQILFENCIGILNDLSPDEKIDDIYSKAVLDSGQVEFLPALFLIASDNIKEKIKD